MKEGEESQIENSRARLVCRGGNAAGVRIHPEHLRFRGGVLCQRRPNKNIGMKVNKVTWCLSKRNEEQAEKKMERKKRERERQIT